VDKPPVKILNATTETAEVFGVVKANLKKDVSKYFNNSYKSLVSSLVESNELSIDEIRELIALAKRKS